MSIFQKHCPECAAPNAPDAISCNCGYCFDPEALAGTDPSAYAHQQDHLYRDYLEARIAQAEAELIVAREQANADPANTYKASGSLLAAQTLSALQAEMKQLSSRIAAAPAARRRSVIARPAANAPTVRASSVTITPVARPDAPFNPRAAKPPAIAAKSAAPIAVSPAVVAPKPAPKPHVPAAHAKSPAWRNALKTASRQKTSNPLAAIVRKAKAVVAARPMMLSKKIAATPARKPTPLSAPPAPSNTPARPIETARPPINGEHRPVTPSVTSRPDESFRRMQAQKADAITRPKAAPTNRPPQPSTNGPAPQRAPADIPPVGLLEQATAHECPNCTASVAAESTRCTCGYALSSPGEEVPAVSLDATALAILTEGISFLSPNRRR
ncbi:MAG TPA: hypothetical protein VGA88_02675 [Burkholderiales bacterium]